MGHKISSGGSVFDITEKPKDSELEDSFLKNATKGAKASRSKPNIYHRKGEKLPALCSHVTYGYMPLDKIKELCKKHGVTITEFFTAVLTEIYIDFQKREEKKQKQLKLAPDGSVKEHYVVDYTVVTDERTTDGHYYANAFKGLQKLFRNPQKLDTPPEKVVYDVD